MEEIADQVAEIIMLQKAESSEMKWLTRLAFTSISEHRHVFPNPLDEPVLWGKFKTFVEAGLDEAKKAEEEISRAKDAVSPTLPGGVKLPNI